MTTKRTGSAKKNLPYHNALILHKSKNLTVKDQFDKSDFFKVVSIYLYFPFNIQCARIISTHLKVRFHKKHE